MFLCSLHTELTNTMVKMITPFIYSRLFTIMKFTSCHVLVIYARSTAQNVFFAERSSDFMEYLKSINYYPGLINTAPWKDR